MEINTNKAKKLSKNSLYSSNSSSSSSSSEFQLLTPKPPLQSRPDSSSLRARQRVYNNKPSDNLDENLMDTLSLNESRPNSSLSKYKALPQIGTKIDLSKYMRSSSTLSNFEFDYVQQEQQDILIGFRLPNGTKKQNKFNINCKISDVLNYAVNDDSAEMLHENNNEITLFCLLQMPNLLIDDLDKTLKYYQIQDKSMLFVIDKSLL